MHQDTTDKRPIIHPDMTILDFVSRYGQTEAVFRQYDEKTGLCLCCQALFDSLRDVADKYGLNLKEFMSGVEMAARSGGHPEKRRKHEGS